MREKSYKWDVTDWSDLEGTIPHAWGQFVGEEDVDRFVTEAFVLVSLQTGISMQQLVEKNQEFYFAKKQLFDIAESVSEDDPRLSSIQRLFMVPVV